MSRTVPAALQTHLDGASTTTCRLIKITGAPVDGVSAIFGMCSLDQDIDYDDGLGDGEITYKASNSYDPSAMASDLGFSVGNAEGYSLLSEGATEITPEMIRAGALDDATWVCYLVNFMDLTAGRHVILDAGDVGRVRMKHGILWMPELVSYAMRLKQPVGGVWSRTCRAVFGSDPNTQTGCGVDVTALWTAGTVTALGAETDRIFTGNAVAVLPAVNYPARVQFLTGDNAGRTYAVEDVTALVVSLVETTMYPVQVGDTYRMRRDCAKRFQEDCITLNANGLNFKGEPGIPVGDGIAAMTPRGQIPGGGITDSEP